MVEIGLLALTAGAFYKVKKVVEKNVEQSKEKKYTKIKNQTMKEVFLEIEQKKEKGEIKEKDVPLAINKRMTAEMTKKPEVFKKEIEHYIQKNMDKYRDNVHRERHLEHNKKTDRYEKEPNYSYAKEFMKMEEKLKEKEKELNHEVKRT